MMKYAYKKHFKTTSRKKHISFSLQIDFQPEYTFSSQLIIWIFIRIYILMSVLLEMLTGYYFNRMYSLVHTRTHRGRSSHFRKNIKPIWSENQHGFRFQIVQWQSIQIYSHFLLSFSLWWLLLLVYRIDGVWMYCQKNCSVHSTYTVCITHAYK